MSKSRVYTAHIGLLLLVLVSFLLVIQWLPRHEGIDVSSELNLDKSKLSFVQLLGALSFILFVTQLLGNLAKRIGEPAVIGEVLGGIVLGPSLLGYFFPGFMAQIFPEQIFPHISVIAQLGIVFYMFVIGLEFDWDSLKSKASATLLISNASIILPMILGVFLGAFTYKELASVGVHPFHYSLFVGISLSVTAFPVLARIITDKKLEKTFVGKTALACAALNDLSAWCLLALCLSLVQQNLQQGFITILLSAVYILFMLKIVRPLIVRWVHNQESQKEISIEKIGVFFVALFLSSLITESIGIHAIFGAFLLGVILPHDSKITDQLTRYTENLSRVVFLPAFFVYTGLRTHISLVSTFEDWVLCFVVILIASVGKFAGTTLAGRYSGISWRESSAIGVLMNTRGLVELVVLNIGLDMGIITPKLFTILVIMALVTTFATSPLLRFILKKEVPA